MIIFANTKKTFVDADTLIMRVFLWHSFMIISGYNKIWNKGCIFWALALWVFMLENQTQAEKWRLFSKSLWFELCTLSALHSFEDNITSWMRFFEGNIFRSVPIENNKHNFLNESLSSFCKMISQHCKHPDNHIYRSLIQLLSCFKMYLQTTTLK